MVSKVPVVDTEVDPPQQNSRPIRLRIVSRRLAGKALIYAGSVEFAFCSWEGRPPCRPVPMRESLRITSSWRLLDVHVVSKVAVVDTEVDSPQPNSRPIKLRIVFSW